MKILFWNLKKNNVIPYIIDLVEELNLDILVLAEYQGLNLNQLLESLPLFDVADTRGACEKIILLYKKNITVDCKQAQSRYAIFTCYSDQRLFHICALHLQDNIHGTIHDRSITINQIIPDIEKIEKDTKISRTVVIGDFNANPFDDELKAKNLFNAVLFKDLIEKTESVMSNRKKFKRFYNPMLLALSEEKKHYGTYYYSNGATSMYWYTYDQVIVRKELVNHIRKLDILKTVKKKSLLTVKGRPSEKISDHLPLYVEVEL